MINVEKISEINVNKINNPRELEPVLVNKVNALVRTVNMLLEQREGKPTPKMTPYTVAEALDDDSPHKPEVRSEEVVCKHGNKIVEGELGCKECDFPSETPEWAKPIEERIFERHLNEEGRFTYMSMTMDKTELFTFISQLIERERQIEKEKMFKEILTEWMSLNLTYDNEKNWNDELTNFSLFMQGLKLGFNR